MNVHPLISAIDAFLAEIDAKLSAAPKEIISDDQIHRFSTKKAGRDDNGWYIFHDGEFPAGSFGDWSTGEKFKWRARETSSLSEKERKRLQKVKVERAKMQEAAYAAAVASAFRRWSNAARAREDHPYLVKKGVGAHGIREAHGALLVPLTSDGEEVISLQTIDAEGNKLFSQNSRTRGGHFFIGEPSSDNIVIVEGYATGASIYEATELPSVIGFNAGNLTEVGKAIRLRFPRARIIFAADDDWGTECDKGVNPGVVNARKAAETVGGCVVIPPFNRDAGETGTDWNDFGALRGKAALKETFLRLMEEAEAATAWGLLLRWRDEDGVVHEWAMPRKLLDGDGAETAKKRSTKAFSSPPARKREISFLNSS